MIASTQQVSEWLSNFGTALDRTDFDAAARMFEEESYWRDLLSLTWNIKTLEGKENIRDGLSFSLLLPHALLILALFVPITLFAFPSLFLCALPVLPG
jgi:hypothetical protein